MKPCNPHGYLFTALYFYIGFVYLFCFVSIYLPIMVNPFRNSNHAQSGVVTTAIMAQNQGGGDKKAGFPHLIARDSWTSIYLHGTSQNSKVLQFTLNPNVRQSRPIYSRPGSTTYWHVPNTGH
jgi:hypothetical protein